MQAHGEKHEPDFAEVAPERIHHAQSQDEPAIQREGGAGILTSEKIVSTLDGLSEQFHGSAIRG